jgi:hypothetical protein
MLHGGDREGGTLLIGVADEGSIVGLASDYAMLSKGDRDGYELFLCQLIADRISGLINGIYATAH